MILIREELDLRKVCVKKHTSIPVNKHIIRDPNTYTLTHARAHIHTYIEVLHLHCLNTLITLIHRISALNVALVSFNGRIYSEVMA